MTEPTEQPEPIGPCDDDQHDDELVDDEDESTDA